MDAAKADWGEALARARQYSPFLRHALEKQGELTALLEAGNGSGAIEWAYARAKGAGDTAKLLRQEKLAFATALAVGDLAGAFPLSFVMKELSELADRTLNAAIKAAIEKRVEGAGADGFFALALGKHGAGELNYSSDIDPILLFDAEKLARRSRDEPAEAAQRYARDIVQLMSAITADGYVFRVDLRLRPASEISPLALSVNAALTHYESSALAWERAAFIRARSSAGDLAAGEEFLRDIRPFVWRRSLDFGAIQEISRLTQRIRANYDGPLDPGPGFNLKQGRGGIREVEFFTQTHQLIHGGRDQSLRLRGTRDALNSLAAAGIISQEDADIMGASYDGLRTIEHRLQMVEDRQTHSIPDGEALSLAAGLSGFSDPSDFLDHIRALTAPVAERFDRLIAPDGGEKKQVQNAGSLSDELARLGFSDPQATAARVRQWTDGRYQCLRSSAAISAFEAIRGGLLENLAHTPSPEAALLSFEELLENAASAVNLFRLIEARPGLLEQLVRILTFAAPLAKQLGRKPYLLDSLIDRSAMALPGTVEELSQAMSLKEGGDYETRLNRLRIVTSETRFALGAQLIAAERDPLEIGAALSRLAEAGLRTGVEAASEEFARAHGNFADKELAIIGLGRLGGGMLTHASDLDIIYLYSGNSEGESDGSRPLGPALYYNRLCQRVGAAISVATAEGALYEIDTRLRPQGADGPLAVSLDAFQRYQREDAWTWEHMALTRARVVAGSPQARHEIETLISSILNSPRDPEKLRDDVLSMRAEMAKHKAPKGPLDVKLSRGGLVDIEFITHYLQLREGKAFHPSLADAIGELATLGLVDEGLLEACRLMTRVLISARLIAPEFTLPHESAGGLLAEICGYEDFAALEQALAAARAIVSSHWDEIFMIRTETI